MVSMPFINFSCICAHERLHSLYLFFSHHLLRNDSFLGRFSIIAIECPLLCKELQALEVLKTFTQGASLHWRDKTIALK